MNKIILLFLLLSFTITSQAQGRRDKTEQKVEAKKIGYLTEKLDLSPEEAQIFWPVYNSYTDKLKSLVQKDEEGAKSDDGNLNSDKKIDNVLESERQKLEIREEYISKFKKVIGSEKTLTLLQSERGFKREMLKGIKRRKEKRYKGLMKEKEKKKDK